MSFFDVPEPPAAPPPLRHAQPEWAGPPPGVVPGVSTQRVVVFSTDRAHLIAHRFVLYPNGAEFGFALYVRHPDDYLLDGPWEHPGRRRPGPLSDELMRVGLLFADGTKWTNLDPPPVGRQPSPPVVLHRGGGGGLGTFTLRYWMWPLPPPGLLTIITEWPAFDIPETRAVVDASELLERAAEAEAIWPE